MLMIERFQQIIQRIQDRTDLFCFVMKEWITHPSAATVEGPIKIRSNRWFTVTQKMHVTVGNYVRNNRSSNIRTKKIMLVT